jgi:tripartite-type tricarboxylate transporter receptor subunit TctC
MRKLLTRGLAAALMAVVAAPAVAEWPNDKPIKFIIPYGPGGGFDTIVRAFAPQVQKALGPNVEVVPENISGAGGSKGAATVYRARPDGYTIGVFNIPGLTVAEVTGKDIGLELNKVSWVANLVTSRYGIAVKPDSKIKSVKDLCSLGRPAKLSETGPTATSYIAGEISLSMIDCPFVQVTGYKGSNAAMIGVMRGEVDATLKPISSLQKYTKSGDLRLIMTLTDKQVVEGVPASGELGYEEMSNFDVRRVIGAPPGLPAEIRERLSDAFMEAANSPQIRQWAEKANIELDPLPAKEAAQMVDRMSDFYSKYKDVLTK